MSRSKCWIAGIVTAFFLALVIPLIPLLIGITIDINDSRSLVTNLVSKKLGRTVAIEGPISMELSFQPGIRVEQLVLANPENWSKGQMASIELLSARLSLLPLLQKQLKVKHIALDGFILELELLEQGKNNWQFGRIEQKKNMRAAPDEAVKKSPAGTAVNASDISPTSVSDPYGASREADSQGQDQTRFFWKGVEYSLVIEEQVEINNFNIQYLDHPSGAVVDWQLDHFQAWMPDDRNLEMKAKGEMLKESYGLDARFELANLLAGRSGALDIQVQIEDLVIDLQGRIDPGGLESSLLEIRCQVPDYRILDRLFGEQPRNLTPLTLTAALDALPGKLGVPSFTLETPGSHMEGRLELDMRQGTKITGEIKMDEFDLSPWMTNTNPKEENEPGKIDLNDKFLVEKSLPHARHGADGSDEPPPPLAQMVDHWLGWADMGIRFDLGALKGLGYEIKDILLGVTLNQRTLRTPVAGKIEGIGFKGEMTGQLKGEHLSLEMNLMAAQSSMDRLLSHIPFLESGSGEIGEIQVFMKTKGRDLREIMGETALDFSLKNSSLTLPSGNHLGIEEAIITGQITRPIEMKLTGQLLDIPVKISATTTAPSQMLLGRDWQFSLILDSAPFNLKLNGLLPHGKWQQGAAVDISTQSGEIGSLAPWLGVRPDAKGNFELEGRVALGDKKLIMDMRQVALGQSRGKLLMVGIQENDGKGDFLSVNGKAQLLDIAELFSLWPDIDQEEKKIGSDGHKAGARTDNLVHQGRENWNTAGLSRKEQIKQGQAAREKKLEDRLSIPILPEGFSLADSDVNLAADQVKFNGFEFENFYFKGTIREGWLQKAPFGIRFDPVEIQGDLSLDLREPPYALEFMVSTSDVALGEMLTRLKIIEKGNIHLDKADFTLSLSGNSPASLIDGARLSARLGKGYWEIEDKNTGNAVKVLLHGGQLEAAPEEPLTLKANGELKGLPLEMTASTLTLEEFIRQPRLLPLDMAASISEVKLEANIRGRRPFSLDRSRLEIALEAPSLNALDSLHGLELPPYGPINVAGELRTSRKGYHLEKMALTVGESQLLGKASLTTDQKRPVLDLALKAPHIQLNDFRLKGWDNWSDSKISGLDHASQNAEEPAGEDPNAEGRDSPTPLLSLRTLERLDANFTLEVDQVSSGADRLGAGRLSWQLKQSHLTLDPLSIELPGGDIYLSAGLWPEKEGFGTFFKTDIENFDYGVLARHIKAETKMQGLFSLHADLESRTPRVEDILKHASGTLGFGVWPKEFEAGILDLWAVSLATAVLPNLDKNNKSVLNCAVGIFKADAGALDQDILLVDTSRIRVIGQTELDFNTEKIRMLLKPQAKRAQIFSLETPIQVRGSFQDFKVGVAGGGLIGTTVRFVASPVVAPLRWVFEAPLERDGSALCRRVWDQGISDESK